MHRESPTLTQPARKTGLNVSPAALGEHLLAAYRIAVEQAPTPDITDHIYDALTTLMASFSWPESMAAEVIELATDNQALTLRQAMYACQTG